MRVRVARLRSVLCYLIGRSKTQRRQDKKRNRDADNLLDQKHSKLKRPSPKDETRTAAVVALSDRRLTA